MAINCYFVLGLPADADLSQVRRAHRQLSLRYHPDRPETADEQRFREVQEAYDTLRDPASRAEHHRQLGLSRRERRAPEPMRAEPIDVFGGYERYAPSLEEILARLLRNFGGPGVKSDPMRALRVEVVLSPGEAMRGGHLPLQIPVYDLCPTCAGSGRTGFFECDECGGHGTQARAATIDVLIPRNVADGTVLPVSLKHLGITNLYLAVQVRVS